MRHLLLASLALAAGALAACHASATVERTTPVANLQYYHSVAIRVAAAPGTESQAGALEEAVIGRLRQQCSFDRIVRQAPRTSPIGGGDLVIDLNILRAKRGGDGFIQNQNLAVLDALLVLSDGVNGDLLGSARIHGKSSAVLVTGGASPEQQAVDVVAQSVGKLLGTSGCGGPRVARPVEPTPVDAGTQVATTGGQGAADAGAAQPGPADAGSAPPPADHHAEAEALNDQGKQKFRSADIAGAMADFEQAASLQPDPRYTFNICLAHEALEEWGQAIAACNKARSMTPAPDPALAQKIDQRIEIIRQRQAGK